MKASTTVTKKLTTLSIKSILEMMPYSKSLLCVKSWGLAKAEIGNTSAIARIADSASGAFKKLASTGVSASSATNSASLDNIEIVHAVTMSLSSRVFF